MVIGKAGIGSQGVGFRVRNLNHCALVFLALNELTYVNCLE